MATEANQNVLNSGQGGTEGKQGKALTEQRMRRVSNLDFDQFLFTWVVEGGIQLWDRSTTWSTTGCSEMLAERIDDQALLHLIAKWLKAGVLDTDGKMLHPTTGSPQGGIISPILANIYLHYALDLWFHKVVKPRCHGEACLIRYADDFVCAFEFENEAQQFYGVLGERLAKFGLTLAAAKTRIIPFSRGDHQGQTSFDFLGFEFRWGYDRAGKPQVKRRTARKKLRSALLNFKVWCQENHHRRLKDLFVRLNAKLRGYYQYYGILGNADSLQQFFYGAMRHLFRWLNQRSQRTSYTWPGFQELIKQFGIVRPKIGT